MPQILMPYTVHLDHTLRVTPMNTLFAKGDSDAHRFELTILRAGMPEDLTGCAVFGKFYRMADSTVVSVPGSVEDGKAVVVLDAACYDYIGRFALTIAIKKGEDKTTVFYGDGYMHGQRADTAISGEYIIYDIDTLLEKIAEIDAATQAANTATENANTAASNANTARDAANTAASTANTAATNANTAKDTANAAAGKINNMTVSATPVSTGTATAELSTVDGHYHLALGMPKGNTGATPQISVQVQTGAAGSEASVSVSGTAEEPVIHLTIPRGDVGDIGNLTINGKAPDGSGAVTLEMGDISGLSDAIANAGGVKTVAGVGPDSAGNVPLTAADVGARPSSWTPTAADVGALAADGTAADSSLLGGKAPQYYMRPRNLLDNSDFCIAQAGYNAYHGGDTKYLADRWGTGHADANLNGKTLTLSTDVKDEIYNAVLLWQRIGDVEKLKGKTVTLAICASNISTSDGNIFYISDSVFATADTATNIPVNAGITTYTFKVRDDVNRYSAVILWRHCNTANVHVDASIDIEWIALYEGSYTAETLPPYVPKGYAAELVECMRYYWTIRGFVYVGRLNETLLGNTFYFPVKMRKIPTIDSIEHDFDGDFTIMLVTDTHATIYKSGTSYDSIRRIDFNADL